MNDSLLNKSINVKKFFKHNWFQVIIILILTIFLYIYSSNKQADTVKVPTPTTSKVIENKNNAPARSNIDATCLAFYSKLQTLEVTPAYVPPVFTQAELIAIEKSKTGEHTPAFDGVLAKLAVAQQQKVTDAKNRVYQREQLVRNYAFCYEYLAETYGYIIN